MCAELWAVLSGEESGSRHGWISHICQMCAVCFVVLVPNAHSISTSSSSVWSGNAAIITGIAAGAVSANLSPRRRKRGMPLISPLQDHEVHG